MVVVKEDFEKVVQIFLPWLDFRDKAQKVD